MTTDELLAILEEDTGFSEADIFITPPENPYLSDEDSGDECENDINHLSGNQLRSSAEARVTKYVDGEIVTDEVSYQTEYSGF